MSGKGMVEEALKELCLCQPCLCPIRGSRARACLARAWSRKVERVMPLPTMPLPNSERKARACLARAWSRMVERVMPLPTMPLPLSERRARAWSRKVERVMPLPTMPLPLSERRARACLARAWSRKAEELCHCQPCLCPFREAGQGHVWQGHGRGRLKSYAFANHAFAPFGKEGKGMVEEG
jgi:hypothetical protein